MGNKQWPTVNPEAGSSLITAIVITLILTSTLLLLLGYRHQQHRLISAKMNFLKAKYITESALHQTLAALPEKWPGSIGTLSDSAKWVAYDDSAAVEVLPWGGYLQINCRTRVKHQNYALNCLTGRQPSPVFDNAVVVDPHHYSLVVVEDTRIYGDVLTGKFGVKKDAWRGRPYSGDQLVYGNITRTQSDQRPAADSDYLEMIFAELRSLAAGDADRYFGELTNDTSDLVQLIPGRIVAVNSGTLASRNWHIRGPGTLRVSGDLRLHDSLRISRQVRLIVAGKIYLKNALISEDALIYSPKRIFTKNLKGFAGQLISESGISIAGNSELRYPALALVYSDADTASLQIRPGATFSGSAVYLTRRNKMLPTKQMGKLIVHKGATVNGLAYSDKLLTLEGLVNGVIITERFHFYASPSNYFNWIRNGTINREKLGRQFKVPVFLKIAAPFLPILRQSHNASAQKELK